MAERYDAIVCGAGAAGLASAAALKAQGVEPVVLERSDAVAASWRGRYEGLRLNTLGWSSGLPGYRAGRRRYGEYPTREKWIEYLEDYSRHHDLDVRFGVEIERIDRAGEGWRVETSQGAFEAPVAVVATGFDRAPHIPPWPGREAFEGELIHAADFRRASDFAGRDVLVVGAGNTGSEIAALIADAGDGRVRVACRTPPNILPRKWLGVPLSLVAEVTSDVQPRWLADTGGRGLQRLIFGNLSRHGLPFPQLGIKSTLELRLQGPAIDDGFVEHVKSGRIELVAGVEALDGRDVVLAGGERVRPEVTVAATGYERGLEPLVGHLDVLEPDGVPTAWRGRADPRVPGLFFVGYFGLSSGQMRQARFEARRVARSVKRGRTPRRLRRDRMHERRRSASLALSR